MRGKLCYFNQTFNVYLYSISERYEDWKTVKETKLRVHKDSATFRLTEYEVEGFTFYTFGILCDKMEDRPGHKGEWSSNDTMVKELFGLELLPIGLDGIGVSMSYDNISKVINPDVFQRGNSSLGLSSEKVRPIYGQWYDSNGDEINIIKCIICGADMQQSPNSTACSQECERCLYKDIETRKFPTEEEYNHNVTMELESELPF